MSSAKNKIQVSKFNQNQLMSLPGNLYCCPQQGDRIPVTLVANEMCIQSNSSSSLWILTCPTLLLHKQVELLPIEDTVRSSPYLLFHWTWPRGLCHWVHSAWHTWLGGDWLAVTWLPTHTTHYWPGKTDLKIAAILGPTTKTFYIKIWVVQHHR